MARELNYDVPPYLSCFAPVINVFGGGYSTGRFAYRECPVCSKMKLAFWKQGEKLLFGCWHAGCTPDVEAKKVLLGKVGLKFRDLETDFAKEMRRPVAKIVATYDYRDEKGNLLYQTCRMRPKDFRQRRPGPGGSWVWSLEGVRRVLYRLPEIMAAPPSAHILCVEGEKDCESARGIGVVATTNVCGSRSPWLREYSEALSGRHCVLIPDGDDAGLRHMAEVAGSLLMHDAASVRVACVPDGKDLTEFLEHLRKRGVRGADNLRRAVFKALGGAPQWRPARKTSLPRTA